MVNIEPLFEQAILHRNNHDCSAYPYEDGNKLVEAILQYNPGRILEIGTGFGYTAAIMALALPGVEIDSLEKDSEHAMIAEYFLNINRVGKRVHIINVLAEQYLQTLQKQYDFIFFDGYQIHYEFLPHYERLLKPDGILYLANNHLKSRTSEQFFAQLADENKWHILDKFAETTIAQRI